MIVDFINGLAEIKGKKTNVAFAVHPDKNGARQILILTDRPLKLWFRRRKIKKLINIIRPYELTSFKIIDATFIKKEKNFDMLNNILNAWGDGTNIAYRIECDSPKDVLVIYSDRPGLLIGKAGSNIELLKKFLPEYRIEIWEALNFVDKKVQEDDDLAMAMYNHLDELDEEIYL